MDWTLDRTRPIGKQICEKLCVAIASGELNANERIPSVRELALMAGVNPNTVQKAFEELERCSLVYSVQQSGWFVSGNTNAAVKAVNALIKQKSKEYLMHMEELGISPEQAIEQLKRIYAERNEEDDE